MRRIFLAFALGAVALAGGELLAQQPPKRVVAFVPWPTPEADLAELRLHRARLWARHGLLEGRDYVEKIVAPMTHEGAERERLGRDIVASRPDLILAHGGTSAQVFQRLTRDIPIVFYDVSDPVHFGLVRNLRHPGANLTGSSSNAGELRTKSLEVIRLALPKAGRVAFILGDGPSVKWVDDLAAHATTLGLTLVVILGADTKDADTLAKELCEAKVDAFITQTLRSNPVLLQNRCRVPGFLAAARFVRAGGFASLSAPPDEDPHGRGIEIAARVLRGEKPGTIPVTQIMRVHLTINLQAARALGVEVPQAILVRADEVFR